MPGRAADRQSDGAALRAATALAGVVLAAAVAACGDDPNVIGGHDLRAERKAARVCAAAHRRFEAVRREQPRLRFQPRTRRHLEDDAQVLAALVPVLDEQARELARVARSTSEDRFLRKVARDAAELRDLYREGAERAAAGSLGRTGLALDRIDRHDFGFAVLTARSNLGECAGQDGSLDSPAE